MIEDLWNETERFVDQRLLMLVDARKLFRRPDGRLELRVELPVRTPWVFVKARQGRCILWNEIFCEYFDFIPAYCLHCCWKIVVKPSRLSDMFRLYHIQRALDLPCKLGLETRTNQGGYRAFFYFGSLEEAQQRFVSIERELRDGLIYPFEIFIKRACTEMEDKFGPSDKWESRPDWAELEARLNQIIVFPDDNQLGRMADWHIRWMFREWIRRCGKQDDTYKEIINVDLFPKTVIYGSKTGPEDPSADEHRLRTGVYA